MQVKFFISQLSSLYCFISQTIDSYTFSEDTDDVHNVFLRTHRQMAEKQTAAQVPLYETTMKYKLNLRMIFKRKKQASGGAEGVSCITQ